MPFSLWLIPLSSRWLLCGWPPQVHVTEVGEIKPRAQMVPTLMASCSPELARLRVLPARRLHYSFPWLAAHSSHSSCLQGDIPASWSSPPGTQPSWLIGRAQVPYLTLGLTGFWPYETGMQSHPGEVSSFIGCSRFLRCESSPGQPRPSTSPQILPLTTFPLEEGVGESILYSLPLGVGRSWESHSAQNFQGNPYKTILSLFSFACFCFCFLVNPPREWGFNGHPSDFWLSTLK